MFLTLGAAAKQYGISKSTLSRALRDGKLTGQRSTETGSYRIEVSELERWRDATSVARATAETVPVVQQATHVATALERVASLESEVAGLRELVRVHSAASDHWRTAFESAQRQIPAQPQQGATPQQRPVNRRLVWGWVRPWRRAG